MTDLAALGVAPAAAMALAERSGDARLATEAAVAALRLADAAAPLAERELRPLGDALPGWFAYRGPDRTDPASGNLRQVLLALRDSAVLRRLGHLPDRPTLVLTGPTPEES